MLVHTLKPGNAFGYSDLLKVIVSLTPTVNCVQGPEYLGEIRVDPDSTEPAECLVVQDPDLVLALYERNILRHLVQNDILPM